MSYNFNDERPVHVAGAKVALPSKFKLLVDHANEAGKAAVEALEVRELQLMSVKDGNGKVYGPFPACGFAWVVMKPNRGAFAKFLREHEGFEKHYAGGLSKWISLATQSVAVKSAYAEAYASVLSEAGFDVYADSRMD